MIKDKISFDVRVFNVPGAGILTISEDAKWQSGGQTGFGIGVSWGKFGYAGGVLSQKEARRLAYHILNVLDENKRI